VGGLHAAPTDCPCRPNRLSTINLATGGTRGFTYDASGNVTAEARAGGTYAYTYNAAGRMAEFRINGVLQASYKYDAMGRQAIRTLTSPTPVTIHSVFDSGGRRIAEYNETTGALIREYVWNGWDPVAVIEGGVISFVRADHIGRPVFATNATGVKVWSATYQPFGGVHVSTGTLPANRFPGQWFQSESGLHQNWMRDYDPTTGRYLQPDPLGLVDGASVYGYVGQNPLTLYDPNGQQIVKLPPDPSGLDRNWVPDDNRAALANAPGNRRFKHGCSVATLMFHPGKPGAPGRQKHDHWHFQAAGGYGNKDHPLGQHLMPGDTIEVCDCPDDGSLVPVAIIVIIGLGMLTGVSELGALGGGVIAITQ
jgi:RHS repeat-associated protein